MFINYWTAYNSWISHTTVPCAKIYSFQKSISYSTSTIKDHKSLVKQCYLKMRYRLLKCNHMQDAMYIICIKAQKVIINYNFVLSRDISKCANYTFVIVCNRWRPPHAITLFKYIFFCSGELLCFLSWFRLIFHRFEFINKLSQPMVKLIFCILNH